jgi:hypothetical protein
LVSSRLAGQDGRVEPVGIRTDEEVLRPWRPSGTDAVHRSRQDPMIGLRPGVSGGAERRTAGPVPPDLAAPGHGIAPFGRRRATGGRDRSTPATGPVSLRVPGGQGIAAQVAAHRGVDVVRWYGVVADGVAG